MDAPADDRLIGQLLGGRFRVLEALGRGGMGTVYSAVQEDLGRRVAIKVILPELAKDPLCLERFRREAEAAGQLGHPNIIQITEFHHAPNEPWFLVMELLEGRPLVDDLKRGRVETRRAVDITMQVLAALEVAHEAGIVHRDLKPENVFLVPLGRDKELVKLLDFGIAKLMDSKAYSRLTQEGLLVGTPRFAAPEQFAGSSKVDHRTDLYAAGGLLYCMLAGRPPFVSSGAKLLIEMQQKEPTDPRIIAPELDPRLVGILHKAMKKHREERYGSAREMMEALEAWANGTEEPAPIPRITAAPRPAPRVHHRPIRSARGALPSFVREHPLLVGGAALLLIGLALLSGLGLVGLLWWSAAKDDVTPRPGHPLDERALDEPPPVPNTPAPSPSVPVPVAPVAAPDPDAACAAYLRRACRCDPVTCSEARADLDDWGQELANDPAERADRCDLAELNLHPCPRTRRPAPAGRRARPAGQPPREPAREQEGGQIIAPWR